MSQSKYWTITLNNYTDEDIQNWRETFGKGTIRYFCFQKEVAPKTGTPHLQAYFAFKTNQRLGAVTRALGHRIHALPSAGNPSQNREYCSKLDCGAVEGTFEEHGEIPADPKRGIRTDLDAFVTAVQGGLQCKKKARIEFKDIYARYPRWCNDIIDDNTEIKVEEHEGLREWQVHLVSKLKEPPCDRKVIFVVDRDGGKGKTWFAKWYAKHHEGAQYLEPGKKADMAYALQDKLEVLFLNVTRTTESKNQEYLYSFIESVKDGMVFSPKYDSRMKYLDKVHVVVMMNDDPNRELLSRDRYDIIKLE